MSRIVALAVATALARLPIIAHAQGKSGTHRSGRLPGLRQGVEADRIGPPPKSVQKRKKRGIKPFGRT